VAAWTNDPEMPDDTELQ